jgi:hypothetical protein
MSDAQSAIVRIITRDKYMLKSLTNFPFLSQSLREFWGRRYNQLIGTILRESIFQPVVQHISSKTAASLIAFLVSGLLHVHLALVTFKDFRPAPAISNIIFFLATASLTKITRTKLDNNMTKKNFIIFYSYFF